MGEVGREPIDIITFLNRKLHLFVNVTAYLGKPTEATEQTIAAGLGYKNQKHKYKTNSNTLSTNENVIREQNE